MTPRAARRVAILAAVGMTVYAAALVVVLARADLPRLGPITIGAFLVAAVLQLAAVWFFGELFRQGIARSGGEVTRQQSYRAALIGSTVARLLPAGGAVTPVAMAWAVRSEAPGSGGAAVRATILNYGGLLVATGVAVSLIGFLQRPVIWEGSVSITGAVVLGVGLVVMGGSSRLGWVGERLPSWIRRRLGPTMVDVAPDLQAQGFVWGRIATETLVLWIVLVAFGIELGPVAAVAAFGLSQLAAGMPGTPGGMGFAEAGLVGALAVLGYPAATTIAPVLAFRVVSYWLPAGVGLLAGSTAFFRAQGTVGAMSVDFTLPDQDGNLVSFHDFHGKGLVVFFYPKAMTPGCTAEACDFRDSYDEFFEAGYEIVGVSPDPPAANARFKETHGLPFPLLSDQDHALAEELGAWGKKKLYGKEVVGLIRSTFVLDDGGVVEREYRNVKAAGHVERLKRDLLGG